MADGTISKASCRQFTWRWRRVRQSILSRDGLRVIRVEHAAISLIPRLRTLAVLGVTLVQYRVSQSIQAYWLWVQWWRWVPHKVQQSNHFGDKWVQVQCLVVHDRIFRVLNIHKAELLNHFFHRFCTAVMNIRLLHCF